MTYLDQRLDKRTPDNQPENVLFFVTDGLENASREFTRDLVFKMIAERRARGWELVFLRPTKPPSTRPIRWASPRMPACGSRGARLP